jgi:hypothetical protein
VAAPLGLLHTRRVHRQGAVISPGSLAHAASHYFAASGGSGAIAWLTFAEGIVIGALTIIAALAIAWRQRVIQVRDRAADREREDIRRREADERGTKLERREKWRGEYEAIGKILDRGETLAYRVLREGPYTTVGFSKANAADIGMECEMLANRGLDRLRDLLLDLAKTVDRLMQGAVPSTVAPTATGMHGEVSPDDVHLHYALRLAVAQDRTAHDLAEMTNSAREALRAEWGD